MPDPHSSASDGVGSQPCLSSDAHPQIASTVLSGCPSQSLSSTDPQSRFPAVQVVGQRPLLKHATRRPAQTESLPNSCEQRTVSPGVQSPAVVPSVELPPAAVPPVALAPPAETPPVAAPPL